MGSADVWPRRRAAAQGQTPIGLPPRQRRSPLSAGSKGPSQCPGGGQEALTAGAARHRRERGHRGRAAAEVAARRRQQRPVVVAAPRAARRRRRRRGGRGGGRAATCIRPQTRGDQGRAVGVQAMFTARTVLTGGCHTGARARRPARADNLASRAAAGTGWWPAGRIIVCEGESRK